MAPTWSLSETTALLRAWHEDVETPAPLLLYQQQQQTQSRCAATATTTSSALYERFVCLCGGKTRRTEVSVLGRREAFTVMWSLISAFNREQQQSADPKEQQRLWFVLPEWEKRMVFAKKSDGKSYNLLDVGPVTFAELDKIMATRRRQIERERQRVEIERQEQERSAEFLRASAVAARHGAVEAVEKPAHKRDDIIISHHDTEEAEDSGSSTESDEEIVILEEVSMTQRRPANDTTTNHRSCFPISGREDDGWHPIITQKNKWRRSLTVNGVDTAESESQSRQKPTSSEVSSSRDPTPRPVPAKIAASSPNHGESRLQRLFSASPSSSAPPLSIDNNPTVVRGPAARSSCVADESGGHHPGLRLTLSDLPTSHDGSRNRASISKSRLEEYFRHRQLPPSPRPVEKSPAPTSAPVVTANHSESRLQRLYSSALTTAPPSIDNHPAVREPVEESPAATLESGANASRMPLWLAVKPGVRRPVVPSPKHKDRIDASGGDSALESKDACATFDPAEQNLISTLLDKHADIPHPQNRHNQSTSTPRRRSDLGVFEVAEILSAQANQLSSVIRDFQALQQADAEHRNQFLEDVHRDEADKKRFREEVEQLEACMKRERDEWHQERLRERESFKALLREFGGRK